MNTSFKPAPVPERKPNWQQGQRLTWNGKWALPCIFLRWQDNFGVVVDQSEKHKGRLRYIPVQFLKEAL